MLEISANVYIRPLIEWWLVAMVSLCKLLKLYRFLHCPKLPSELQSTTTYSVSGWPPIVENCEKQNHVQHWTDHKQDETISMECWKNKIQYFIKKTIKLETHGNTRPKTRMWAQTRIDFEQRTATIPVCSKYGTISHWQQKIAQRSCSRETS